MSIVLEDKLAQMERKLDELESRAAIRDLVTDYCQGFDNHNWEQFISIWHEDAVWEILEAKEKDGLSARYIADLRSRLGTFAKKFGDRYLQYKSRVRRWL